MATKKEKCLEQAVEGLKRSRGRQDPHMEYQQPWVRYDDGTWRPLRNTMGTYWKYIWMAKLRIRDPEARGAVPIQVRRPDMTCTLRDESKVVVDAKFTRKNGTIDSWQQRPGMSKSLQQKDYNEINAQEQHGGPKSQDLVLHPEVCECDKKDKEGKLAPEPYKVPVRQTPLERWPKYFVAPPTTFPSLPGMPGVPDLGLPVPLPEPIIP